MRPYRVYSAPLPMLQKYLAPHSPGSSPSRVYEHSTYTETTFLLRSKSPSSYSALLLRDFFFLLMFWKGADYKGVAGRLSEFGEG